LPKTPRGDSAFLAPARNDIIRLIYIYLAGVDYYPFRILELIIVKSPWYFFPFRFCFFYYCYYYFSPPALHGFRRNRCYFVFGNVFRSTLIGRLRNAMPVRKRSYRNTSALSIFRRARRAWLLLYRSVSRILF